MCSSLSDGGAALFICSEEYTAKRDIRPVFIHASSVVSATEDRSGELVAIRAARAAYEEVGIGPCGTDSLRESWLVCAGRCAEADPLRRYGSRRPHSGEPERWPSFARSSRHPVGATGVAQIVQLTEQLRGTAGPRQRPGAKVARAENNGGQLAGDSAVALATILST
jgi:acetyl-CoA acyltransferase